MCVFVCMTPRCVTVWCEDACMCACACACVCVYMCVCVCRAVFFHWIDLVLFDAIGANIFITADGSIKIGDFGLCVQIQHTKTRPEEIKGTAGTAGMCMA